MSSILLWLMPREGLHEHHDGGDAGARDFGGVVERAGGKADERAGDFVDGLLAEVDELGVEGDGLDRPDAGPVDGAAFFLGEAVAGLAGFAYICARISAIRSR